MIDYRKSAKMNNTTMEELKTRFLRFPCSTRKIIAICDNCHKTRILQFHYYSNLCRQCAAQDVGHKERQRQDAIKRNKDSDYKEWIENRKRQIRIEDPSIIERQAESLRKVNGNYTGITTTNSWVLVPNQCDRLNEWFLGSHFHHLTKSLGVYIPKELHIHYYPHNCKTGYNMDEINLAVLQYINGGL